MNGNTLYLVCTPCSKDDMADFGVKLAQRPRKGKYSPLVPKDEFAKWLTKHATCGGEHNPDHFQLAHLITQNSDQRTLQDAIQGELRVQ